jgi:hypothetical protein
MGGTNSIGILNKTVFNMTIACSNGKETIRYENCIGPGYIFFAQGNDIKLIKCSPSTPDTTIKDEQAAQGIRYSYSESVKNVTSKSYPEEDLLQMLGFGGLKVGCKPTGLLSFAATFVRSVASTNSDVGSSITDDYYATLEGGPNFVDGGWVGENVYLKLATKEEVWKGAFSSGSTGRYRNSRFKDPPTGDMPKLFIPSATALSGLTRNEVIPSDKFVLMQYSVNSPLTCTIKLTGAMADYGAGFKLHDNTFCENSVLEFDEPKRMPSKKARETAFRMIMTKDDVKNLMTAGGSVAANYSSVAVSAQSDYMYSKTSLKNTIIIGISDVIVGDAYKIKVKGLNEDGKAALKSSFENFEKVYGTHFFESNYSVSSFMAALSVTSKVDKEKSAIYSELSAVFGQNVKLDAQFSKACEQVQEHYSIDVNTSVNSSELTYEKVTTVAELISYYCKFLATVSKPSEYALGVVSVAPYSQIPFFMNYPNSANKVDFMVTSEAEEKKENDKVDVKVASEAEEKKEKDFVEDGIPEKEFLSMLKEPPTFTFVEMPEADMAPKQNELLCFGVEEQKKTMYEYLKEIYKTGTFKNNDYTFIGTAKNGVPIRCGTMICPNRTSYYGYFNSGLLEGSVKISFEGKSRFVYFKDGLTSDLPTQEPSPKEVN